jgi:hypothetical protein
MKKTLTLICFSTFFMLGFQVDMFACLLTDANISGPRGRCVVAPNTPITYTGDHNFSSSGCTYYEWEIEGGTITAPGGVSVMDGKLCITENFLACASGLDSSCDAAAEDFNVGSGNGADVTVVWRPNVDGKLKLKAKEKGSTVLEATDEISVDLRLPNVTFLNTTANSPTSTTFAAVIDNSLCPGMTINWTLDNASKGTGFQKTLDVGLCAGGTVCAFTSQTVGGQVFQSTPQCITYTDGSFDGNIQGPNEAQPNSTKTYSIFGSPSISSVTWSLISFPPTGASFSSGNTGNVVDVTFGVSGLVDLTATGTTACGPVTRSMRIQVSTSAPFSSPGKGGVSINTEENVSINAEKSTSINTKENVLELYDRSNVESNASLPITTPEEASLDLQIIPSLVTLGQQVNIQLPIMEKKAQIWVSNTQGQQMMQMQTEGGQLALPTSELTPGMYFVTVKAAKWQTVKRFVIQ